MLIDSQPTVEVFVEMLRRAGLDPSQHDIPELHNAWLRLNTHMQRLRQPRRPAGQQTLSVFDPLFLASQDDTEQDCQQKVDL